MSPMRFATRNFPPNDIRIYARRENFLGKNELSRLGRISKNAGFSKKRRFALSKFQILLSLEAPSRNQVQSDAGSSQLVPKMCHWALSSRVRFTLISKIVSIPGKWGKSPISN